jgi:hypothetical protein
MQNQKPVRRPRSSCAPDFGFACLPVHTPYDIHSTSALALARLLIMMDLHLRAHLSYNTGLPLPPHGHQICAAGEPFVDAELAAGASSSPRPQASPTLAEDVNSANEATEDSPFHEEAAESCERRSG